MSQDVCCRHRLLPVEKLGTITKIHRYSEGIDVLYAVNQFEFNSIQNYSWFSVTIPPQRLDAIRNLYISYMFEGIYNKPYSGETREPHPPGADWTRTCDIMARMKGLQVLGLYLYLSGNEVMSLEQETIVLAPLTSVKLPKLFFVDVSWVVDETDIGLVDRPFCLSRAVEYSQSVRSPTFADSSTDSIAPIRYDINVHDIVYFRRQFAENARS